MTSYTFDTGTFLQQFTNSVSHALHKQNCTCSGRGSYTAGELRLKSNPTNFDPNFIDTFKRQSTAKSLPPISRGRTVGKYKPVHDATPGKHYPPKIKLGYEFIPHDKTIHCRKVKKLGDPFPTKRLKRQSDLPERMDVTDKNGHSWQIVQNFPKQHKKKLASLRPVGSSHQLESETPSNSSHLGYRQQTTVRNTPFYQNIHLPKHNMNETDAAQNSNSFIESNKNEVHFPIPTCKEAQIVNESPHVDASASHTIPRESDRKYLLLQLNSAVRKGHITYHDFLQRASQLASALSKNDNDVTLETRYKNHNKQSLNMSDLKSGEVVGTSLPYLTTNNGSRLSEQDPKNLPLELENLYARGNLKILKFDIGGVLPDNFLERDKEELRQMYPMYNWHVGQGIREIKDKRDNTTRPVVQNTKETINTHCARQIPVTLTADKEKGFKEKVRFTGREWKGQKRSTGARSERITNDRLESVKECLERDQETAMVEEQVEVTEMEEELRACSGLFPRQPPPTPMETQRKQTMGTLKESVHPL